MCENNCQNRNNELMMKNAVYDFLYLFEFNIKQKISNLETKLKTAESHEYMKITGKIEALKETFDIIAKIQPGGL